MNTVVGTPLHLSTQGLTCHVHTPLSVQIKLCQNQLLVPTYSTTSSCATSDHGNSITSTHARYCTSQFASGRNTIHLLSYRSMGYMKGVVLVWYNSAWWCMGERPPQSQGTGPTCVHVGRATQYEIHTYVVAHTCSVSCMNALQNAPHSLLFRGFLPNDRDAWHVGKVGSAAVRAIEFGWVLREDQKKRRTLKRRLQWGHVGVSKIRMVRVNRMYFMRKRLHPVS